MPNLKSYSWGFGLSLVLTLLAYWLVASQQLTGSDLVLSLAGLAVAQVVGQLLLFMHLGSDGSDWRKVSLLFAFGVILIIVFGSLWIMYHLNYSAASPSTVDSVILQDEGIQR